MSAKRVEYHQGAIADIKNAVAWYHTRSRKAALDFIEELTRATETIREARIAGHAERTIPGDFCFGGSLSPLSTQKTNPQLQSGPSPTAADDRIIGRIAANPW